MQKKNESFFLFGGYFGIGKFDGNIERDDDCDDDSYYCISVIVGWKDFHRWK